LWGGCRRGHWRGSVEISGAMPTELRGTGFGRAEKREVAGHCNACENVTGFPRRKRAVKSDYRVRPSASRKSGSGDRPGRETRWDGDRKWSCSGRSAENTSSASGPSQESQRKNGSRSAAIFSVVPLTAYARRRRARKPRPASAEPNSDTVDGSGVTVVKS
jgi:hypothetical protein